MVSDRLVRQRIGLLVAVLLVAIAAMLTLPPSASAETPTPSAPTTASTPAPAAAPTGTPPAPASTSSPAPTSSPTTTSSDSPSVVDQIGSVLQCVPSLGAAASCVADAVTSEVASSWLDSVVDEMAKSFESMLEHVMSWWINAFPIKDLQLTSNAVDQNGKPTGLLSEINSPLVPIQILGLTISTMFFAARMAWNRKQSLTDDSEDGFKLIVRATLATTFIPAAIIGGGQVGDAVAKYLLDQAGANDGTAVKRLLALNVISGPGGLGTGLMLLLLVVGFLGMLLQLFFLAIRTAMLIVVVAGLPVAASFSGTGVGSQAYSKMISWAIAFCLFKPIGALCYFIAFKAADSGQSFDQALVGLLLLMLAGFVLPALMRLIAGGALGSMGAAASGAAGLGMAVGAGVAAASLGATAAGGGAGSAATGMSLKARAGGNNGGGDDGGKSSPPPPNPPVGPGPQDSGGSGESSAPTDTGGGKKAMTNGAMAAGAAAGAGHAMGNETEAAAPSGPPTTPPPPHMQSGWGQHAMVR